jgi:hypothetical protein
MSKIEKKHHSILGIELNGDVDAFIDGMTTVGFRQMDCSDQERKQMLAKNYMLLGGYLDDMPCMMKVNLTPQSKVVYSVFVVLLHEYEELSEFQEAIERETDKMKEIYKQEPERHTSFSDGYYNLFRTDRGFTSVIGGHNIDGIMKPRVTLGFFDLENTALNEKELCL